MRIVMMGTGSFAEPTFARLLVSTHEVVGLVTQPDRAVFKETASSRQPRQVMKELAVARGIPVLQPQSINTPEGVAALTALKPDLLVVAAYGQILSKEVLSVAPKGGINVHASLLPKYRGAAPINWAIYHGEAQSGVTIIRMSISLDAGDMLAQEAIDILPTETAGELEARLGPVGARLAIDIVDRLAVGPVSGLPQDKSLVTKAPKLTKEQGLIDWSRPAFAVCNQIRAMQPWPTAYTYLRRDGTEPLRLIICTANEYPVRFDPSAPSGKVFTDEKFPGSLFVVAGPISEDERSVVEIAELQPAGKRRMSARDFLRGNAIPPGARLAGEAG